MPGTFTTPDWLRYLVYEGTYWASLTVFTLGFSLRAEGRRHVPRKGPALLIANHQSFLDPVLVGVAARRHLHFLARKTLFRHRAFAWFIRSVNSVPVDQAGVGIEGMRTVLQLLREGRAVLVFPEGHRTRDGAMRPLLPGIQLLIKRSLAPVVPVGIAGSFDAWPPHRPVPAPAPLFMPAGKGTLAVSIRRPLDPRLLADLPRDRLLADLHAELQKAHERAQGLRRKE